VPEDFRFALKVPRQITHIDRLAAPVTELERFVEQSAALGHKRGPLLVQLPPSLAFEAATAQRFFSAVRNCFDGDAVCEPRHPTWFAAAADAMLMRYKVARVAADPPPTGETAEPGGYQGLFYYRLHGSPRMYTSAYDNDYIDALSAALSNHAANAPVWCIFDNTRLGAACGNALHLLRKIEISGA
jgi:uncharacterized protein YecE (DUF72 family)